MRKIPVDRPQDPLAFRFGLFRKCQLQITQPHLAKPSQALKCQPANSTGHRSRPSSWNDPKAEDKEPNKAKFRPLPGSNALSPQLSLCVLAQEISLLVSASSTAKKRAANEGRPNALLAIVFLLVSFGSYKIMSHGADEGTRSRGCSFVSFENRLEWNIRAVHGPSIFLIL